MRQSDPTSNARLRKSEREQGKGQGQGQGSGQADREYQTIKVEVELSPGERGPPSSHSVGRSRRSRGSGDFSDMPTSNEINEGFAFPADKD